MLTHTQGINLTPEQLSWIKKLKRKHAAQDNWELQTTEEEHKCEIETSSKFNEDQSLLGEIPDLIEVLDFVNYLSKQEKESNISELNCGNQSLLHLLPVWNQRDNVAKVVQMVGESI